MPPNLKLAVDNDSQGLILPGVIPVESHSSDQEIQRAVDAAGEYLTIHRPAERRWDWSECEGCKQTVGLVYWYGFVQPEDISLDPKMPKRLSQMIREGLLTGNVATGTHVRVVRTGQEYRPRGN